MVSQRYALTIAKLVAVGCLLWTLGAESAWSQDATKNVSISFNQAPVRQAFTELFQQVGLNYSLDPSIQGTVTASLKDIPFTVALDSLLKAARPQLTYMVRDDVYDIHPRVSNPISQNRSSTGLTPPVPSATGSTVRIPLDYANAGLLMQLLGGGLHAPQPNPPSNQRYGSNNNRGRSGYSSRYGSGNGNG